jgi:DNA repair exonuclease SbcCD ATPase subunit
MFKRSVTMRSAGGHSSIRWLAILFLLILGALARPSLAQDARGADAVTPVEEFSRQLEELKKTFIDLNKRIESSAKAIDRQTSADGSRREIEELRDIVSTLLGAVADNGEISRLGAKALEHAHAKQKSLRDETRYTPEQREFLLREWGKLAAETETATAELDAARTRFAKVLRTLQTNDDYVGELMEIRQGGEALKVIRDLAKEIHETSDMLNNFINTLSPPRSGT